MRRAKISEKLNRRAGFSLAETLLVVIIITLLLALIVPNVISTRRSLAQRELDAKAELIYTAAQNQIVKLRAAGQRESYQLPESSDHSLPVPPCDREGDAKLYYFSSADRAGEDGTMKDIALLLMPDGVVEPELLGSHWVVEYDPLGDSVYAVFYSEELNIAYNYVHEWDVCDDLRVWDNRIETAKVGYYGGDVTATVSSAKTLQARLEIKNGEKLTAHLECSVPAALRDAVGTLTFRAELRQNGKSYAVLIDNDPNTGYPKLEHESFSRIYSYDLTLDDLSGADTRFDRLYGANSGHGESRMAPDKPVTLYLTVSSSNHLIKSSNTARSDPFSPLFDNDSSGARAVISCARHLQNLDGSSGVSLIRTAVQKDNIDFANTTAENDWYDCYGGTQSYFNGKDGANACFFPITNAALTDYDGGRWTIAGLNAASDGGAGLFGAVNDLRVHDLTLTGAKAGGADAGALAGRIGGAARIENCRVYLTGGDLDGARTKAIFWIDGTQAAGGLVGAVESGASLHITDSFAATGVVGNAAYACGGGLVGSASGTVEIASSYADCWVKGAQTGGLIGGGAATLTNCYASGSQTATSSAAGLANGAASMTNCYAACAMTGASTHATAASGTANNVWYLFNALGGGRNLGEHVTDKAALVTALGDRFRPTQSSTPYYLDGVALTPPYPYPCLTDANGSEIPHYGDWPASFQPGGLVYYEKYAGVSRGREVYGFYGADTVSSLRPDGDNVVGDGYGVVYEAGDENDGKELTACLDDGAPVSFGGASGTVFTVESGGVTYHVYPLPTEISAADLDAAAQNGHAGFYHKLEIAVKEGGDGMIYVFQPWLAKTAHYLGRTGESVTFPSVPDELCVRTPRHLRGMSLYYEHFAEDTRDRTFRQECDIDYNARERDSRHSAYDWKNFASCELHAAQQQEPIGASGFLAKYDAKYDGACHTISHVSIVSKSERYVGLFGRNEGTLSNILLVTNFDKTKSKNYFVQRTDPISANNTAYIGLLTGYNEGKIENCAVAGYYVAGQHGDVNEEAQSGMLYGTLYAYQYSTLCAGGLAGGNSGTIRNSTADCPAIHISAHHATAKIGGFVGENTGAIEDCYALGHIEATYAEEGSVRIAGFAGFNEQGSIRESYCAVSLIASGSAAPYGFAPLGGYADACSYLDDGTYRYVGMLRAYKAERAKSAGTPSTIGELRAGQSAGYADSLHSAYHKNTNGGLPASYPYRAVVKDGTGAFAHYGDWQNEIDMGDMGVFYWEHETGGSNNGYHFSYVGTKGENKVMSGTTLCTAHDDGGTISEYGYGYYHRLGETVSLSLGTDDGESAAGVAMSAADVCNEACARMLESQASGYRFYPYTTRTREEAEAAAAAAQSEGTAEAEIDQSYLYLSSTQHPDGKWTLTYDGTIVRNYRIAPFFANAMYLTLDGLADQSAVVTSEDGCTTDYRAAAGGEENPYEVRSARQLQYINWNYAAQDTRQLAWGKEKSVRASGWDAFWSSVWDALRGIVGVDTLSEKGNFWQFTYLQYATPNQDKNYRQTSEDVFQYRPRRFWRQSHDIACDGFEGFTPIAGTSSLKDNNALLYTWFGGDYDGQSYKIQNLAITSDSFSVGVFGVTAGANIKNIILYGNTDAAAIERDTSYRDGDGTAVTGEAVGSYAIGGLIGIAMDYDEASAEQNAIENCAIAGYRIVDRSTNQQGIGGGNVGGLIGVSNVSLKRCSAVTDISIACTHNNGAAQWGNYIRAGGLVGAAKYDVTDCYAGGEISVAPGTVNEFYDNSGSPITPQPGATYSRNKNVHIYVSGMSGSTYSSTFANFAMGDADSKTAALTNCYVYTRLPVLEGTIKGVSLIGSVADRYGQTCSLKMTNCYYLAETMENLRWENLENKTADDELATQTYFFSNPGGAGPEVSSGTPYRITRADWEDMLNGNTAVNKKLISADNKIPVITGTPISLSYDQLSGKEPLRDGETVLGTMPALLNPAGSDKAWDWVTTVEGESAKIDGKYSFPGERDELLGKNYPFPTVVRQRDTSFGTQVNVHYGEWPNDGCYWKMGRDSMDIFADMEASGWAEKTLTLYDTKGKLGDSPVFRVEPADAGIAELLSVDKDGNTYTVRVRALKTGAVSVVALDRADEAQVRVSCVIEVTANISITTTPEDLMLYHGQKQTLNAFAKARADALKDYTDQGTWSIRSAESGDAVRQSQYDITGGAPGSHVLTVEYTYDYHAGENGMKCREMLYVPYQTLGILGVGSAEGHSGVWRRLGNETSVDTEHGAPNCPQGADVYLYETTSDKALDSLAVSGVTIAGEAASHSDGGDVDVYTAGNYTLTLDKTAKTDGAYACRAGTLLCRSAGAQDVAIRFTVTYGIDGEDPYELTTTLASVPTARIEFHANGGTGAMRSMGVGAAEKPLPACAFTREGCSFSGWNTQPDGSGVSYAAGAPISAAANVTDLYAQWQANRYTVLFDGNGGTGSISSLTMTYGGEAQLLPNDYTREGFTLVGWNTEMDGSGAFYALHQAVSDLTAEDGATVFLFAQWEGRYTLTLQSAYFGGGATRVFHPSPETARLSGYAAPVWQDAAASGTLNGWYSANDGTGVKVLNADGSIAAAVEHYTDGESGDYSFELDGDRTLYAGWSLDVYAPTDHLEAGETYAIVATRDGAAYLISENEKNPPTANGGRKDAKRSAITLQDGYFYPSQLSDDQKTKALWTALADTDPNFGNGYFNLQNAKGNYLGQAFLRSMVYATLDDSSQNDGRKNVVWLNSDAEQTIVTTQGRCIFINESNVIRVDTRPADIEAAKPYAVATVTQFR